MDAKAGEDKEQRDPSTSEPAQDERTEAQRLGWQLTDRHDVAFAREAGVESVPNVVNHNPNGREATHAVNVLEADWSAPCRSSRCNLRRGRLSVPVQPSIEATASIYVLKS